MESIDWSVIFSTLGLMCTLTGCAYYIGTKMQRMRGDIDVNEERIFDNRKRIASLETDSEGDGTWTRS